MRAISRVNWPEVRRRIRKHWLTAIITAFLVVMVFIFAGYWFDWTGFNGYNKVTITHILSGANADTVTRTEEYQPGKTLWDWLQLLGVLAIPVAVGFATTWYTAQQEKVREKENTDNQREMRLQTYIDNISALVLHEKLRESGEDDEVRNIARVRTLTVLPRLDGKRQASVLQFLHEAHLIDKDKKIIDLGSADLSGADFGGVNLSNSGLGGVDFGGAKLFGGNFSNADLSGVNLRGADLFGANFSGANFSGANLVLAHLKGATLTGANFTGAAYVKEDLNEAISYNESMNELDKWYDQYKSKALKDD